jgi:hypothetical protein
MKKNKCLINFEKDILINEEFSYKKSMGKHNNAVLDLRRKQFGNISSILVLK